jgi:microcystin-dependent protein
MARREYTSGRPTTLSAPFDIGATTFTIADDGSAATWPTSIDYDFFVTIDAGTAQEERVLCSGRSARVVTVAASGRGADGTTESNHLAGATVWPSWSATDADESNVHIESTGYASYSKSVHGLGSGDGVVVGTTKEQTLTLKTLTSPKINDTVALTASSTELNILDGATLSTAELNYVDGVTSAIQTQLNTLTSSISTAVPAGVITQFGGSTAPAGWKLCDGTAYSRTVTYNALFDAIGITYGGGDGSTTFNVPNLKGRIPVGLDSTQSEFDTLGETGGVKEVTLTTAQIPNHSHAGQIVFGGGSGSTGVRADGIGSSQPDTGGVNGTTGGAHTNLQPYIVVNYIIKF